MTSCAVLLFFQQRETRQTLKMRLNDTRKVQKAARLSLFWCHNEASVRITISQLNKASKNAFFSGCFVHVSMLPWQRVTLHIQK